MREVFSEAWLGIRRDENYTYFADGTKERSNETTVEWNEAYYSYRKCAASGLSRVVMAMVCYDVFKQQGICEKSVCKN